MVSWVIMPGSSENNPAFQRNILPPFSGSKSKLAAYFYWFLAWLIFDPKDGGHMFLLNIGLSLNYMALQPRR
jgi:hypothetical protein